jgi:hypothetical protein
MPTVEAARPTLRSYSPLEMYLRQLLLTGEDLVSLEVVLLARLKCCFQTPRNLTSTTRFWLLPHHRDPEHSEMNLHCLRSA